MKRNAKRVLRFDDTVEAVTTGFRCEICWEIFLQKHDALIHQYEKCLPKKGTKKTTPGEIELTPDIQPRAETLQSNQPVTPSHQTGTLPIRTRSKSFGSPN